MKRRTMALAGAAALGAAAAGAWLAVDGRPAADPEDAALVALGRQVYARHCAACHGARLEGQPNWRERRSDGRLPAPPHDESGHTWHHSDAVLIDLTRRGTAAYAGPGYATDMPAFGALLSEREIVASIAFIKHAWPEEIRRRQRAIDRSGR